MVHLMKRSIGKTLKWASGGFLIIFALNLIYTLPTSLDQIISAIVVSAAAAVVTVVVGWIYGIYQDRKDRNK